MISQPIEEPSQIGSARRAAIRFAQDLGFPDEVVDRVGLVVTEAGTNLTRHAKGGRIFILEAHPPASRAIKVVAVDSGPGIASVEKAMADGYSTAAEADGGMGVGLGSIRRQSDDLDIYSDNEGTVLIATFLARASTALPLPNLAGLIAPKPGFSVGGDAFATRPTANGHLVMLVDVLGHGPVAQDEAQKAIAGFLKPESDTLEAAELAVSDALAGERGAA
ncbi:ATP-binding protein, partial [Pararhizobium haloflavum]|uniref:ATP-binding protein n=1 Tax=Pararhizobium haloflavum TaxID=2037914 RepID=UPI0018E474B5